MQMEVSTPALLFPAISLLFLAYTNRFQVLALLIRQLHDDQRSEREAINRQQTILLNKRIFYIKAMQSFAVIAFLLCTFSMFSLVIAWQALGVIFFGMSLISLCISLVFALVEILSSTNAIKVELKDWA